MVKGLIGGLWLACGGKKSGYVDNEKLFFVGSSILWKLATGLEPFTVLS